jgi:hypothetical protein
MLTRVSRVSCPHGTPANPSKPRPSRALAAAALAALALGAALPDASQAASAPLLRARGSALEWTRAGRHNRYKVLIRLPGEREIVTVIGRTFHPRPIPGTRVIYRVKAVRESRWSNRITITYPGGTEELEKPREEGPPLEEPAVGAQGKVKYRADAASYWDRYAVRSYVPWVRSRVALIKGYPPFADIYVSLFGLPVIGYHDPATEGQAPLAQNGIESYVAEVARDARNGYRGVFIDDANWSPGFTPSPGPPANLANLIEAVARSEPGGLIEINSQYRDIWRRMQASDPNVARALQFVSSICVEFGVGPTSGISSPQDYAEFMQYADQLHGKGIALTLAGDRYNNNVPTMEYNLATYFLINDGRDYVLGTEQTPGNWWSGFEANLGSATSARERLPGGVWTRRFTGGVVYTTEPGARASTINLPRQMHSAEWGTVSSITLAGGQGAVLTG